MGVYRIRKAIGANKKDAVAERDAIRMDIRDGQIYLTGGRTKNGKPREIPVTLPLAEELAQLPRFRDDGYGIKRGCGAEGGI